MRKILSNDIDIISICHNISYKSKLKLIEKGRIIQLNKKEILFYEKDEVNKIYILLDGKATMYKYSENGERKVIFILCKGDILNEVMVDAQISPIGCEAFEKCTILEYNIIDFLDIMKDDFELTKNYISYMERRTRRLYRQVKNSMSIKMEKKLGAKLYRISKEYGVKENEWTKINIDITITYLSDMLGCPRESVSRAMKNLEKEKLVKVENKKIYIKKEEIVNYFKGK